MIRKITSLVALAVVSSLTVFFTGCDWTSGGGGSDFNTSQGAGVNVNWSGVYFGQISGKAVAVTSGGTINRLVMTQIGNRLEVTDNQGSRYVGAVGSPELLRSPSGVLPAGSVFVESQVSFSGKDEVAGKDINFVGIIHVVAISDIDGSTEESTTTDAANNTSGTASTNITRTIVEVGPDFTNTTEIVVNNPTSTSRTIDSTATTTTTRTYQITESTSQFRLQGTWIEDAGVSAAVDAISPGGIGSIVTTDTTTTAFN